MATAMLSPPAIRDRLKLVLEPAPRAVAEPGSRPASILIPILASTDEPRLVLTRRSDQLSRHAGEISFPGGLIDDGEDAASAALREAEEELGLAPQDVELLGAFEPVHTHVSGVLIVPFVGLLWRDPRFTPNAAEIAEVLEYPLSELVARAATRDFQQEGRWYTTDLFDMDGNVIWGATARILRMFLDLLDSGANPSDEDEREVR
jgi:8-oxo-dGTP pyrophosphatase MutT (NUDIX family)